MRDKEIRSILIAYLQTFGRNLRIYQEKSIGASICDVMAVTDRLTGYEIKSDCDNYARLEAQIKNYDNFFDRNYLVVSDGHLSSAEDKVPDHWGILCIRKAEICMVRKARDNRRVSRKRQLSILWKLELKNLLTKNDLPLYAQKPKSFLIEKLAEQVDYFLLGKQIAEELLQRDYSVYQATDHTLSLSSDAPFPTELVDTLSEQDPAAFTLDKWIDLYRLAQEARREKEALCTAREMERTPHEIPYTEIEASLGAPWIEPRIVNDFLHHILAIPNYRHYVHYEPITGNWHISEKPYLSEYANAYTKYGTPQYPAPRLLEATLNLREIKVYIKIEKTAQYDEAGTLAALEKQKELQEEFTRWLWLDEDRRWQVEAAYNKLFNGLKKQTFDGSGLTFPEMNPAVSLYDYQKNAVMRITSTPNTLLAFDVGAGKTYIMIAAAMKMRREGLSEKNLFVVPNNIVGQWEQCFTTLYPRAKVLTVEPKSFKPEMRAKVLRQIQQGGYDGIIIAYSCFEMIPLSSDFLETQLREKLDQLDAAVNKLRFRNDWGAAPLERLKKELQAAANELLLCCDQPVDELTFDRLEINTLFLDEAHNYKNIPIRTHLHNVNGINTKGSAKCRDMMLKVQCVQQQNGGRGAVFATGTPLCNSISDVYALQMYLQYEELKARKLDVFDQWVKTFAKPERLCEIDVDTASYRFVTRFSRFYNLPELSALFAQVADFHATEPAGLPDFKGYTNVFI
ncbi:MAG: sce7726 family protein [Clostridia bacterium]|nr:sce7726 family protein [Clostridia bacterium]